jgi:hypothetical protein
MDNSCHILLKYIVTCRGGAWLISRDRILMRMHIYFLQPNPLLVTQHNMYELLHLLNFRHGLMMHINAYFACFMNNIIFSKIYIYAVYFLFKMFIIIYIFIFYIQIFNHRRVYIIFLFRIRICCIFNLQHFFIQIASWVWIHVSDAIPRTGLPKTGLPRSLYS